MAEPAPRTPLRDPRGWLLFLALAAAIGMFMFGRGRGMKSGPNLECLTHQDCASSLRCYAVPKDDPFATFGVCVELCPKGAQCEAGTRCVQTGQGKGQLLPPTPELEPGEPACVR